MGALSVLVGGAAAWLGKIWPSVESFAEKPGVMDRVRAYLPAALGALFAACLLVVFGGVLNFVLAQLQARGQAPGCISVMSAMQPKWLPLILQALVAVTLFIGVMTFRHVNVNRFSMHAVYRNRLTRAFLGSARNKREQDPFTGFDPRDNTPLSSLLRCRQQPVPGHQHDLEHHRRHQHRLGRAPGGIVHRDAARLRLGCAASSLAGPDRDRSRRRVRSHDPLCRPRDAEGASDQGRLNPGPVSAAR